MRRMLVALLFGLGAVAPSWAAAPPVPPRPGVSDALVYYREAYDVRYAPGGGSRHTLDVFYPDTMLKEGRPVVIFVHGGTWMVGDKNFFGLYRGVGKFLARHGVVAVLINYRLSPGVKHPEHVKDVALAYAWTHKNIGKYGGDRNRIVLAGHSAGAHLVSLLATDESYLKNPALELDADARGAVKGVMSLCGVYRVPGPAEYRSMAQRTVDNLVGEVGSGTWTSKLGPPLMLVSGTVNPFNHVFGKDEAVKEKASPLTHVRAGLPPFLVVNAESEVPGLCRMAEDFVQALRKHAVPVEYHEIEGKTHRDLVKDISGDEVLGRVVLAFLKRRVG